MFVEDVELCWHDGLYTPGWRVERCLCGQTPKALDGRVAEIALSDFPILMLEYVIEKLYVDGIESI